jgi:hypothetical protein
MLTVWMIRPVIASFVSLAALLALLFVSAVPKRRDAAYEMESIGAFCSKNRYFSASDIIRCESTS